MKYLLLVVLSITLTYAHEIHFRDGITPKKFPPITLDEAVASNIDWEKLRSIVVNGNQHHLRAGSIEADVTNYTLEILHNVASLIVHAGLDPLGLSDATVNIFPGHIDLTNGWLQDLSSITVSDEVIAKYTLSTHVFELTLPLAFGTILLDYNYHVKYLLLSLTGTLDAKITDLRIDLHLGFNFTEHHAFVDNLNVKNTGEEVLRDARVGNIELWDTKSHDYLNSGNIDIKFTGLGLLDWLIDLMASGLINMFHTLIFSIVNAVIYNPVQSVVNTINGVIDALLNSTAADFQTNTNFKLY